MTNMVTADTVLDARALASEWIREVDGTMFLAGGWSEFDRTLEVRDPEGDALIGSTPAADGAAVLAALAVAADARRTSRALPAYERSRILHEVSHGVEENAEVFATVIAMEGIKTVREARAEAARCAFTLRLCAEEVLRFTSEPPAFGQYPGSESRIGMTTLEPAGVVSAITPFNDPLNLVAHKVGPALAAGNTVVLKPHEQTPFSALLLARLFERAGLPPGVLQVITGRGSELGDSLVADPRVRVVSFTGGWTTGRRIAHAAGVKKLCLELGGNCPTIVMADADLEVAVSAIASGAYWAAGQNCLHVQRLLVQRSVLDEVLHRLAAVVSSLRVGAKLDDATDMGCVVSAASADRIESGIRDAVAQGGRLVTGGGRDGAWIAPTLLEDVPLEHPLWCDEVFGPVTVVQPFHDLDDAIRLANGVDYGLQAGIFTDSLDTALTASQALDAGTVLINDTSDYRLDSMPFGGSKKSGIGREGVRWAMTEFSEPKVVCFNRAQ